MMNSAPSQKAKIRAAAILELRRRAAEGEIKTAPLTFDDLSIVNKHNKRVTFNLNRAQQHYYDHRTGRDLILKARQLGMSAFIEGDCTLEACNETARIAILAHDDRTTQALRRMTKNFWLSIDPLKRPHRTLDNATTVVYENTNSEVTITTAGSTEAGRGSTYTRVHGSEVAFWKDAESIMAGIMQGVPAHGRIELESTPNGAQGWFYDQCMMALDPNSGSEWTLHFYEWWWDDEYRIPLEDGEVITYTEDEQRLADQHNLDPDQIKWRRSKQRELGAKFPQEYPEDIHSCFLTSGNSVFGDFAKALYTLPADAKPDPKHDYIGGVDWGQSKNYTALSIIDATDNREVVVWRMNHAAYADMRREIVRLCDYWRVSHLYVEKNSASSNVEAIQNEFEELQKDRPRDGVHTAVIAFVTTNKRKAEMVNSLYQGIHEDELKLLNVPYATSELRQYQSVQTVQGVWTYDCPETPDGAHGDTVIGRMAAYWGCTRRIPSEW